MGSILAFQLETDKRKQIKEIETRGERDVTTEGKRTRKMGYGSKDERV